MQVTQTLVPEGTSNRRSSEKTRKIWSWATNLTEKNGLTANCTIKGIQISHLTKRELMRAISRLHIVARGGVMETKAITLSESLAVETEDTCSLSTQTRNKSNIGHDARDHLASGCAKLHSNLTMSENPLVQPLEKIRIRLWNVVI
jgi:hypothetical protein